MHLIWPAVVAASSQPIAIIAICAPLIVADGQVAARTVWSAGTCGRSTAGQGLCQGVTEVPLLAAAQGRAPVLELPLPEVDCGRLAVHADAQVCHAGAESRAQPEELWHGLEAPLLSGVLRCPPSSVLYVILEVDRRPWADFSLPSGSVLGGEQATGKLCAARSLTPALCLENKVEVCGPGVLTYQGQCL